MGWRLTRASARPWDFGHQELESSFFNMGVDAKRRDFLNKNGSGKMPTKPVVNRKMVRQCSWNAWDGWSQWSPHLSLGVPWCPMVSHGVPPEELMFFNTLLPSCWKTIDWQVRQAVGFTSNIDHVVGFMRHCSASSTAWPS